MTARPRIGLIHATSVAVEPIRASFAAAWPDAELANLLDDSLTPNRIRRFVISAREPLRGSLE